MDCCSDFSGRRRFLLQPSQANAVGIAERKVENSLKNMGVLGKRSIGD